MSGYEEQLYARAEMLEETGELAADVTAVLDGASGAGVDPAAVAGLRAAIAALDPAEGTPGYQAGTRADRHPGTGYGSDAEFLEAISDAETGIAGWLHDTGQLGEHLTAALGKAHDDLDRARRGLADAKEALANAELMPVRDPCDGCHGKKDAAIAAAEAAVDGAEKRMADAIRRIGVCEDTAEILDALARRLQAALRALRQVPHDLGEVYQLVYDFIRRGGKMPRLGRWIEGAPA